MEITETYTSPDSDPKIREYLRKLNTDPTDFFKTEHERFPLKDAQRVFLLAIHDWDKGKIPLEMFASLATRFYYWEGPAGLSPETDEDESFVDTLYSASEFDTNAATGTELPGEEVRKMKDYYQENRELVKDFIGE